MESSFIKASSLPQYDGIITWKDIYFPYEQTPQQRNILNTILEAIRTKKDCLVESATGTGKTLCLLSSCLTAVHNRKASRVFYFTRTHSQMECIIKQLNESKYDQKYDSKFAVVQSKKGLCANREILSLAGECTHEEFQSLCSKSKQTADGFREVPYCPLSQTVQTKEELGSSADKNQFTRLYYDGPRQSIGQIKTLAAQQAYCPKALETYFGHRVELIIMSYKYVCDPFLFSRKKLGDELPDSILIFDEAHNIIQTAKDESSIQIKCDLAEKTLENIIYARDRLQSQIIKGQKNAKQVDETFVCLDAIQEYTKSINQFVQHMEKIYASEASRGYMKSKYVLIKMDKIYNQCFKQSPIANYPSFYRLHAKAIQSLDKLDAIPDQTASPRKGRKKLKKNFISIFTKFCYMLGYLISSGELLTNYLCALHKAQHTDRKTKKKSYRLNIDFVCLSSKYTFARLKKCEAKSIIFASGTLNHSEFEETQLKFLNYFQEQSNFQKDNISTFIINEYRGVRLEILSKEEKSQQRQIAEILQQIVPLIPYGVLIFFKSYDHMNKIQSYMNENWTDLKKDVFWEQKQKFQFDLAIKEYSKKAQTRKGAVLMAICRGKASQGYNFKDNLARAVFIIGYPLMSFECLDYKVKEFTMQKKKLQKWYYDNAMIAVKQAMGRLIRHSRDFGCVYLIGQKLYEKRKSLPSWVTSAQVYDGFQFSKIIQKTKEFVAKKDSNDSFNCPVVSFDQIVDHASEESGEEEEGEGAASVSSRSYHNNSIRSHFRSSVQYPPQPARSMDHRQRFKNQMSPAYKHSSFEDIQRELVPAPTRRQFVPSIYSERAPTSSFFSSSSAFPFTSIPSSKPVVTPKPAKTQSDEEDSMVLASMLAADNAFKEEKKAMALKRQFDESSLKDKPVLKKPRNE